MGVTGFHHLLLKLSRNERSRTEGLAGALAGYVDEKGRTENVCIGTNAKNSKQHYLTRPTKTGNFHGQAAVLWTATALLRLGNRLQVQ